MTAAEQTTTTLSSAAAIPAAAAILDQCRRLVDAVGPDTYAEPCPTMMNGTIGAHVRHALDHFSAAMAGLRDEVIDYDRRARDTPTERDPKAASERLRELIGAIERVPPAQAERPVSVRVMLSADGSEAELESTLGRELAFAAHHAIHHHAMIAVIARELGAQTPEGFGKAPSTLNHERS